MEAFFLAYQVKNINALFAFQFLLAAHHVRIRSSKTRNNGSVVLRAAPSSA